LQKLYASANRLDALIQDVLNYSKIARAEMKLEAVDPKRLVQEILESYPNLQPPAAVIRVEGRIPAVLANRAALTQVMSNLLGNGVKFVAKGVLPELKVWAENVDRENVRIWFEDNGIGIRPDARERIFMMFQRLNAPAAYEGTGIGLTIVKKAMERMGGKVGVESQPGAGSRFWITLARASGE
jgi:signal transduction histidine kinase